MRIPISFNQISTLFCSLLIWSITSTCLAQEEIKISASDGELFDEFGRSVALYGNTALIGTPKDKADGISVGSVYVYELTNGSWSEVATFRPDDVQEGDQFGHLVVLEGHTAVISALGDDDNGSSGGSVYFFEEIDGTWTQVAKFVDPVFDVFQYGEKIAIDGNTVFVKGGTNSTNFPSGTVHVYNKVDGAWEWTESIRSSDENTSFGRSLSIDGRRAIIGGINEAYVFGKQNGGWQEISKIEASDGALGDEFGRAVHLNGKYAIISAPLKDEAGLRAGAAYIYELRRNSTVELAKLTKAPGGNEFLNLFGEDVYINQHIAVVSAPGTGYDISLGEFTGVVYVYEKHSDGWVLTTELRASDAITWYRFGNSISWNEDRLLVGTYPLVCTGIQGCEGHPGAAYYYDFSEATPGSIASETTAHVLEQSETPRHTVLHENYPNPFNPVTTIRFDLKQAEHVRLSVYNMLGQKVRSLVDGVVHGGAHEYTFDAQGLPSGSYLYLLETSTGRQSRVMLLLE